MSPKLRKTLIGLINFFFLFVVIILQYMPAVSLEILGGVPALSLAAVIAISMFCSELSASLIGLAVGTFTDTSSAAGFGFNSLLFFVIAFLSSFLVHYLFNNNFRSAAALGLMLSCFYFILNWLFFYIGSHTFTDSFSYLFKYALPSVIYTAVVTVIFYFFEKFVFKRLNR